MTETPTVRRNWLAYAAYLAALLLLSVIAIALGVLGLREAARGNATNRVFAWAGIVLGGVGLLGTAAAAAVLAAGPGAAETDLRAQHDVSAVGAELATQAGADGEPLSQVIVEPGGYTVGDAHIAARLEGEREVTVTAESSYDWCLELTYAGGEHDAVAYRSDSGLATGGC